MANSAAVDALQKPIAQHGRNVFPLDNRHVYSMKAGQITPVKAFHFMPNDYFDISAKDFGITFPMNTAAFLRGRKEFKFYSVYYNAIWSLFNQYQSTRPDPKTSVFGDNLVNKFHEPRIATINLYLGCFYQWLFYIYYTHILSHATLPENYSLDFARSSFLKSSRNNSESLLHVGSSSLVLFKLDDYASFQTMNDAWKEVGSPIYFIPRGSNVDDEGENTTFVTKNFCLDILGHFRCYSWVRKLDMLGYGNIYPLLRQSENRIISLLDSATAWDDTSHGGTRDSVYKELYDLYAHICMSQIISQDVNIQLKYVNLYPLCAYNAIFYHWYRNSYYDLNYDSRCYSLDFLYTVNEFNEGICSLGDFSWRFLDIEYHQWKKDTFTAVLPYQQFGAVSTVDVSNVSPMSITGSSSQPSYQSSPSSVRQTNGFQLQNVDLLSDNNGQLIGSVAGSSQFARIQTAHTHTFSGSISSGQNLSFDVIALRRAEMLQQYRQQLARAGNRTSDVFRALYGSSPSSEHEDDMLPRFLETFGSDIFVDPIESTASTGQEVNGSLGDLSARGKFFSENGHVKFNAGGNFGVILCLCYIVPTAEYNSYMFDKHLFELTPEQHFIQQFENLGLEEVYSDELNCLMPANRLHSLGLAPRYHHKKQEFDMVHGAFCSLPAGVWYRSQHFSSDTDSNYSFFGDFNHWVSPRSDFQNRLTTEIKDFYINPSVLDNVFVRPVSPDLADDQFICNTFFNVKSTREMSKVGMINFV